MPRFLLLIVSLLLAAGCSFPEFEVSPATDGPYSVSRYSDTIRVRGDEVVETDFYLPASGARRGTVVFIQGGAVEAERYSWIGEALAGRGYVSIHPHHPTELALFSSSNGAHVLKTARRMSARNGSPLTGRISSDRAVVIGHSLGGVVAASLWVNFPEEFADAVILASFPAGGLDPERDGEPEDRVVSIVGGEDPRVSVDEAAEGLDQLGGGTLAVVEGVTHYQFGDFVTDAEAEKDGTPGVTFEEAHDRIFFLVESLLEDPDRLDAPESWPEGVVAP